MSGVFCVYVTSRYTVTQMYILTTLFRKKLVPKYVRMKIPIDNDGLRKHK
jgi:hypothetical protein